MHDPILLLSTPNLFPRGRSIFAVAATGDAARWLEPLSGPRGDLGATGLWVGREALWALVQEDIGGLSRLVRLDHNLVPQGSWPLHLANDAHSLVEHEDGVLIAATGRNAVVFVGPLDGSAPPREREVWRMDTRDEDTVHLNGVAVLDGHIFVSAFGPKPMDGWGDSGCGMVKDLTTGKAIASNLRHPHSLMAADGALLWLESRLGRLWRWTPTEGARVIVEVPGYVRGLAVGPDRYFIGVSGRRRTSRSLGTDYHTENSDRDAYRPSVFAVDRRSLVSTRIDLAGFGPEIFDIAIVPAGSGLVLESVRDAMTERVLELQASVVDAMRELDSLVGASVDYAEKLVNEQRLDEALPVLELLIKRRPRSSRLHYLMGYVTHYGLSDIERARDLYDAAERLGEPPSWMYFHRSAIRRALGDVPGALHDAEAMLRLDPRNADAQQLVRELRGPAARVLTPRRAAL